MCKRHICLVSLALILGIGVSTSWAQNIWEGRIQDGLDDVEQQGSSMYVDSSDLEFVADGNTHVGLRFPGVMVPRGSAIFNAYMEFQVDELEGDVPANLLIYGELSPDAAPFTTAANNVSDRRSTVARVAWSPEHYPTVGEKVQTVDISPIIEEIVGQSGWRPGNALVLIVIDDPDNPATGHRTVEAGVGDDSALLHIDWGSAVKAAGPGPNDEEVRVSRDTDLNWSAGTFAAAHNVYLGTSFADVNTASTADPMGVLASEGQTATTFDPGRLEFGQTYYWRIDEVNSAPDRTVFAGDVWSFTVEPIADPITDITVTASGAFGVSGAENTINGSGLVGDLDGVAVSDMWLSDAIPAWIQYEFDRPYKLHELWVWNSNQLIEAILGFGAKEVVIEHSLNGTDWTVLEGVTELAQATGQPGAAASDMIDFGGATAQHVRISISSIHGFAVQASLSEVRFYAVPTRAAGPSPASGATDVAPDVTLAWASNGREAASHDVYVGTDADNLSLAGSVSESSFDTTAVDLQLSQAYYWRVDEVNDAEDPTTWTGDLWSFSTADAIIIDDMESYRDEEQFEIWATWEDGFVDPDNNGALVGANPGIGNFAPESSIVHGGAQSLPIHYDNRPAAQSEATRSFAVSQDWTRAGATTLVVWFHGAAGNSGQLYLKVNGNKVSADASAGDIGLAAWQAWSIDLASLGNITSVRSLAVGVEGNGASGTLYVDDITLVQSAPEPISEWRVATSEDDGEEHILDGGVMESLTSSDLELGYEGDMSPPNLQTIGVRWVGVSVPRGATITEAYVQFSADSVGGAQHARPVSLVIQGELSPNGGPFAATAGSVTGRQFTSASVVWDIPEWLTVHAQGPEERTPDISSIIQEIVNQAGWAGEAIVLSFADNPANPSQGTREAESFDGGGETDAPLLVIRFE